MAGFQRLSSPSLSNRANAPIVDYTSIFSSFHSLKTPFNSIPVLHFPVLVEEDEASVVHAPNFDYSEIFGCFDADDFAVPYDQLFAQTSSANARSSVEMESQQQTPPDFMGITVERFEEEPFLCSDKNQLMTNEISHQKISEMNASYKQINKRRNEDSLNQTTHMVQLHEVTGYTFVVDACSSSQTIKHDKPPPRVIDDLSLKLYSKGGISEGENFGETVSCSAVCSSNDLKAAQEGSKFTVSKNAPASNQHHFHYSDDSLMSVVPRSYSADKLLTVCDIHLQTKPSQLPPPSRPPPKLVIKQDGSKKIMAANPRAYPDEIHLSELLTKDKNCQSVVPSETTTVKGSAEDVLPPFFDIEIDARSATSAPAASTKEAIKKGQERLKNARELIEIKSDNLQSDVKIGVDEDVTRKKKRDGKIAHENHRVKELSPLEARECFLEDDWQKATRTVQMDPDFREKGELFELSMPSLVRWKEDLEDFTTLASHKPKESRTGWKAEKQFYELVKGEEFKCTDNVPELELSQKKLNANLMVHECQLNVKKAAEEEAMPKKNEKSSKHVENGEKLEAAKEVHKLQENNNKLKSAQEDHILEDDKRNLEATHECQQQEKKLKAVEEACQGGGGDKEVDAVEKTCNLEENWKEVKAAPVTSEQEEYDKKLKPSYNASSCEENKKTIKTATPLKEAVIKYKQDEHCKILKEAGEVSELEGTEKKVKAVHHLYACWDGIKAAENVIHDGEEEKVREAQETNKWAAIEKEIKVPQVASEWGNLTVAEEDHEQMRELGEKKERDNIFIRRATGETCNRAFMEARERVESFVAANITSISYRRALKEVQERTDGALEALERASAEKPFVEDRMREEDAVQECAPERVNDEAASETRERADGFITENLAYISRDDGMERVVLISTKTDDGMKQSVSFLDTRDSAYNPHMQSASSSSSARGYSHSIHGVQGLEIESARRCQARLERHQRTIERAAKALAERKFRDILIQREQAERNRLSETLDADVRRWSNGKQGNLRALLSTLQYILGPESGWQPIPLTDVITAVAVKKAYRKAALCVHPDKVQQRGASIQQKYICEKVYDLLKEAWNKFNYEG